VKAVDFFDYRVPRIERIPDIHIGLVKTDNHPTGVDKWGRH